MNSNFKLSEVVAIAATLDPSSQAVGAATTTWVSAADFQRFAAVLDVGSIGAAGTVVVAFSQATTNTGTGAKPVVNAITGAAVTSTAVSLSNQQVTLDMLNDWLDSNNGYGYVAVTVTVGVNAVLTQATLFGLVARYGPASAFNQAGVVQVI